MGRYTGRLAKERREERGKELRRGGLGIRRAEKWLRREEGRWRCEGDCWTTSSVSVRQLLGGLFDWFPIISLSWLSFFSSVPESVPNLTAYYLLWGVSVKFDRAQSLNHSKWQIESVPTPEAPQYMDYEYCISVNANAWSSGSPSPSLYISEGVTRTSSWLSGLYDVMDHNNVFTGPGSQLGVRVERFREVHINTDVPAFTLPPLLNAPHTTWPTQPRKNIPFDPLREQEACGRQPSTCFLYSERIEVGSKKKQTRIDY